MTVIVIVATPSFDAHGKRRLGRFDVRLQGVNEVICEATQQPMLDASRLLLRRGVDPSTTICKVRADAPSIVTMRALIGIAADFDVMGEKFVRRKPDIGPMSGSGIENPPSYGPGIARRSNAALEAPHNGSLNTTNTPSTAPSSTPSPAATITAGN
jgi:hypothetical protein